MSNLDVIAVPWLMKISQGILRLIPKRACHIIYLMRQTLLNFVIRENPYTRTAYSVVQRAVLRSKTPDISLRMQTTP